MFLNETEVGKLYKIVNLNKLGKNVRNRITDLGIVGCYFLVIVKIPNGPMQLSIRNTRIALGRGITEKIEVEEHAEKL